MQGVRPHNPVQKHAPEKGRDTKFVGDFNAEG
jgi:hypothetical protein